MDLPRHGLSAPADVTEEIRAVMQRVADHLEPRLEDLVSAMVELYLDQIPGYALIPQQLTRDNTRDTVLVWLDQARSGTLPEHADDSQMAELAHRWWSLGTPLDLSLRTIQLGARAVVEFIRASAAELDITPHLLDDVVDFGWRWAILNAAVVGNVYRREEVHTARRDATRLADFLRDLAHGRMTDERLLDDSKLYRLNPTIPYFAIRMSVPDSPAASAAEAHLRRAGATTQQRVVQVTANGELYALAPRRPAAPAGMTIAVGPATQLSAIAQSFADAEQALVTALAFGITGTVDLPALLPLPIATAAQDLASRLSEDRLSRLDDLGQSGHDIEHTVLTLLDHNQNVEETATVLHLHRNSVRHRVGRFQDLTGLDIQRTDDLITTWWLLKWRFASRSP